MITALELAGLFLASAAAAYAFHRLPFRKSRHLKLCENGLLRISTGYTTYRTRVIAETPRGWLIASPLQRDAYVPLHINESLLIQAPQQGGIIRFRSIIIARHAETHYLEIAKPESWQKVDRRNALRTSEFLGLEIQVEGRSATLVDLSEHGAKVVADGCLARGERVLLQAPWSKAPAAAWVLDVHPDPASRSRSELRLCFEEPVDLERVGAIIAGKASLTA